MRPEIELMQQAEFGIPEEYYPNGEKPRECISYAYILRYESATKVAQVPIIHMEDGIMYLAQYIRYTDVPQ
jgi:hypothetical protein